MFPVWALILILAVAGFVLLLIVNGRRKEDDVPEPPQKKIPPVVEETPKLNTPSESPIKPKEEVATKVFKNVQKNKVEEAHYVDDNESTIGGDFYEEVAELFLEALKAQPERQDLRLKLLDVYYDSGNKDGFLKEANAYKGRMHGTKDANWHSILKMGKSLLPAEPLFGGDGKKGVGVVDQEEQDDDKPVIRRFGDAPEVQPVLEELAAQYKELRKDPNFYSLLDIELIRNSGRPAPWLFAQRITEKHGGAKIFIKREDLNSGRPRLRTQLVGQAWIAKQMGKEKVLFSAADGEEAVVAARAAACMGMNCLIYISAQEGKYRESHKFQVQLMGAEFVETLPGDQSGDIRYAALDTWLSSTDNSFMMIDLQAGPHPYPTIANDLQSVIGRECVRHVKGKTGKYPNAIFARGSGSPDAIGFVDPFLGHKETKIVLVNPETVETDLQNELKSKDDLYHLLITNHQKLSANKLLEDTEYPRVDREHSLLAATGRVQYKSGNLEDAKSAIKELARSEGVIFPLGSAHVLAEAIRYATAHKPDDSVVVMLTERLDKDLLLVSAD